VKKRVGQKMTSHRDNCIILWYLYLMLGHFSSLSLSLSLSADDDDNTNNYAYIIYVARAAVRPTEICLLTCRFRMDRFQSLSYVHNNNNNNITLSPAALRNLPPIMWLLQRRTTRGVTAEVQDLCGIHRNRIVYYCRRFSYDNAAPFGRLLLINDIIIIYIIEFVLAGVPYIAISAALCTYNIT